MKKVPLLFLIVLLASISGVSVLGINTASADSFNQNRVIDDGVFDNTSTMNAARIDAFLNIFPNSCISTNNGFSAPDPTGYNPTNGYLYGNPVSAGQVIYDAAQAYGLNPQVILSTLQKEEGTVVGNGPYGCSALALSAVAGYACTDSDTASHTYNYTNGTDPGTLSTPLFYSRGTPVNSVTNTCVNSPLKAGFTEQVIRATWLLRFGEQRSRGNVNWAVIKGNWNNSDDPQTCYGGPMTQGTWQRCPSGATTYYDGYTTIDATAVHMETGGTAALYWYTPHFPGNQSFDIIFTQWFGSIYTDPYVSGYDAQSAYPQINPGQQATVYLRYKNSGNVTWYDDQGLASASAGTHPVHLATASPLNRTSAFSSTWPTPSRPTVNFSAVYNPDGTTLASNQHVAQPGQIVKFSFAVTANASQLADTYQEYFQPVLEGSTDQWFNNPGTYLSVTVNAIKSITYTKQSPYPTVAPSTSQAAFIEFSNSGNVPLYDDQSLANAPAGNNATHLAVSCPLGSSSDFAASNWTSPSRPAVNFSAVYNPDGTTLASNQHVAQSGQIVKFSFDIKVPSLYTANTYKLCLQPILEGTSSGVYPDIGAYLNINVPSAAAVSYGSTQTTYTIVSGEQKNLVYGIQNSGNAPLLAGSKLIINNGTIYQDPSWTGATVGTTATDIAPGASGTVNFTLLAPVSSIGLDGTLNFQVNTSTNTLVPNSLHDTKVQVVTPDYSANYVDQSAYPTLSYGQTKTVTFRYKNTGNKIWYDDASINSATSRSPQATHLATAMPLNRASGFAYNWPSANRPALTFNKVYAADKVTLASNQHVVQPGQVVEFSFTVAAQPSVVPNSYREYFQPIIEGSLDGRINFQWTYMDVRLDTPVYKAAYDSQSAYPTLSAGQTVPVFIAYKNIGNVPWFDDSSISGAPGRQDLFPVHLATARALNRTSMFTADWPTTTRPDLSFSTVYERDGSTLANNQHVVQPGQIAKFAFNLTAPSGATDGTHDEYFQPIAEGTSNGLFNDTWTFMRVIIKN